MSELFCFGLGYSAMELATLLKDQGFSVSGTVRQSGKAKTLSQQNINAISIDEFGVSDVGILQRQHPQDGEREFRPDIVQAIARATHLLVSIAPNELGDPVLNNYKQLLVDTQNIKWIGYLSTVGVYGNHDGAWVDEETTPKPLSTRSKYRVQAENEWLQIGRETGKPVQLFRLAGIYGPGRNPLDKLRQGRARRIDKPCQVFNRIHVRDIARALIQSIEQPRSGAVYNVTDDEPAPPQDVIAYAADLLNMPPPPLISFEDSDLSPLGRSFYGENKRVSNARMKGELNFRLKFPTYREGLAALADEDRVSCE